jgi:hypothetical protein
MHVCIAIQPRTRCLQANQLRKEISNLASQDAKIDVRIKGLEERLAGREEVDI